MIGTDEMSSTGMDISETFRAEELTKTDFFDFVSAPDMGIGIGVGADVVDIGMGVGSLHAGSVSTGTHQHHQPHQQQQQQQHTHHQQHSHQQQQQQQHAHHQQHSHEQSNNLAVSMPHDGGGGTSSGSGCVGGRVGTPGNGSSCLDGSDGNSNGNNSDPTLQGYEFWHTDKDSTSRLDATIFEDLDRYYWQQQGVGVNAAAPSVPTAAETHQQRSTPANSLQHSSHLHSPASPNQTHPHKQQQQQQHLHHHSPHQHMHTQQQQQQQQHQQSAAIHHTQRQMSLNNSSSCAQSATQVANNNATNNNTSLSHSQHNNNNNASNSNGNTSMAVNNSDGQIYTITVLNGNESWLKREPEDTAAQLSNTLDLDSLLGSFPGYIKTEYPYDESSAGYGTAEASVRDGNVTGDMVNGLVMGANATTGLHGANSGSGVNSQRLPSLVTAISLAGGVGGMSGVGSPSHTQLAQFQNNNNDWHMADHNAEQNSAESLLRSALQGKGYSKGIHMQNGISLLPSSPSVKEDEMRRLLFPPDSDTLSFGDSTLSAAQMFEDTHSSQLVGSQHPNGGVNSAGVSSLMVDDMFLSLESAFSDDFEKIKRIANEVQQFCSPTSSADYGASDVLMQISPAGGANAATTNVQQLQQQLLSPATTPTSMPQQQQPSPLPQVAMPALHMTGQQTVVQQQPRVLHAQQQHVSSGKSSAVTSSSGTSSGSTTKVTKKYKRSTSSTQHHNNNNNNPNITNHNSGTGTGSSVASAGSSSTANSTNGPASGGSNSSNSSNSPTHCNGQRKERSLHYCSICSKGFKDKYSVNVHIRTHTGEKPFTCSLCGKSFRQKAHLAKHYQTHMAQKHNGGLVKSSGGSGGGGGGVNSSKHQRAAAAAAAATAAAAAAAAASTQAANSGMSIVPNSCAGSVVAAAVHQRQLNVAASLGMAEGVRAVAGGVVSTVAVGGPMNGPTLGAVNANVLPPANGLLANR